MDVPLTGANGRTVAVLRQDCRTIPVITPQHHT
jgi:hypothetical protein